MRLSDRLINILKCMNEIYKTPRLFFNEIQNCNNNPKYLMPS